MKLELGYNHDFEVRDTGMKLAGMPTLRILFISDLHFGWFSAKTVRKLLEKISELDPHLILFGGDYIDLPGGRRHLASLLGGLPPLANVFAIAGNHDYLFGLNRTRKIFESKGATWLHNTSTSITIGGREILLCGNTTSPPPTNAALSILFTHRPADFETCAKNFQIVFGGHLHGGQVVLWQNARGLYPGRLFYRWNVLEKRSATCRYFMSKGMGDTLPIRFNCKRDIILLRINPET
ncbi:metallophosphoesterase [Pedobacter sp. SYP-B3415]|uniref:metallophosphoesterase n=1 Tax=Pedobacter sp. SYP-B3415 TaxID=2496641 RepID=UPI0013EA5EB0|nr:metallophosphoesterase [Pedobacter sp. SYP-B3415]